MSFSNSDKQWVSPSRTYVAMCMSQEGKGTDDAPYFYRPKFRKFTLPELDDLENNSDIAAWYFLNRLDAVAAVWGVFPVEHYQDYDVHHSQIIDDEVLLQEEDDMKEEAGHHE